MNVKPLFAFSLLALAAGTALADEAPGASKSRAEVVQSVLAARAAGTLIPAGEAVVSGFGRSGANTSTLTRAQVSADVIQARANGTLVPAGVLSYADATYARDFAFASNLTRAQVKADVLQARADGTLVPAGQGSYPLAQSYANRAHHIASQRQGTANHGAI